MKKRILAWIALGILAGLVITTVLLGILGNPLFLRMLGLTMGVSIVLWALLWFQSVLTKGKEPKHKEEENKE